MEDFLEEGKKWPMLLDFTKDECQKILRAQELSAYNSIVSVFRAQGELTKEKKKMLHDIQTVLNISLERHKAEIRRVTNDEILCTVAHLLAGPNTSVEWAVEGRRLMPLLPRAAPLVAYSAIATRMAQKYCGMNYSLPRPSISSVKDKRNSMEIDSEGTDSEEETAGLRYFPASVVSQSINIDCEPLNNVLLAEARCASEKLKNKKRKIELHSPAVNLNVTSAPDTELSKSSPVSNSKETDTVVSITKPIGTSTPKPSNTVPESTHRRKRKRSVTSDPTLHKRPPPVVTLSQNPVPLNVQQVPVISIQESKPQLKLDSSENNTCVTALQKVLPASTINPQSQKVILVATSAANSSPEISYIRSNNISIKAHSPLLSLGKESISLSTDKPMGNSNIVGEIPPNLIGTPSIQIKPTINPNKATIQVRQDSISGRVISRTSTVSSSPQNVYVVTTNSGMITVVARTVASQSSIGGHRMVSVNTVVPRSSHATVTNSGTMSLTVSPVTHPMKTSIPNIPSVLRPTVNQTKNSVIVLQRSNISTSNVRSVGLHGFKDTSTKNVQRTIPNIVHGTVNKTNVNGACANQNSNLIPGMLVIKPHAATTKVVQPPLPFTPTSIITEVPARTMASNLIYVEPNFVGKKTSTIRTTLTLTSTADGGSFVSSRQSCDEPICRVTPSRIFTPVTTIMPPSVKRQVIVKGTTVTYRSQKTVKP